MKRFFKSIPLLVALVVLSLASWALDRGDPHDILAALLVYRTVFYLLPLAVGLVLFTLHELRRPLAPSSTAQASGTR